MKIDDKTSHNSPSLRFPEFTGEWENKRIGDIGKFFSGGTPSSSRKDFYGGEIPFIRSGEIHSDKTELFLTQEGYKNSSAKMVEVGDILLALYGANSGDISISQMRGAINQAILCIRTNVAPVFFKSVWEKHAQKILNTYLQGGQGNLSADIVKKITISIPSQIEQAKIAALFSHLDERISIQNRLIDRLQSLMIGLNNSLYEQYGNDITTSFMELGYSYSGLSGKSAKDFGSGKPFITYLNVYSNIIVDETDYQYVRINDGEKQNIVRTGDVLFTLSSETPEEVGIGSVYLGEKEVYLNSFCFGIHIERNQLAYSPYLSYYVTSTAFRKFIYPFAQGSTRFNLCKADFEKASIKLPSLDNQKRISAMLDCIAEKIQAEKAILEYYNIQRQYLLRQMFI
uniref:restriction endonuclease subunit S n=2 Tax=Candidatus Cryptobacteroides bacterium TaxID=3085639 RepID=UPI0040265D7A